MKKLPFSVKVIAVFWALLGVVVGVVVPLAGNRRPVWDWSDSLTRWLDGLLLGVLGLLCLKVSVGLVRRERGAWHVAVGVAMLYLLFSVPLAVAAWVLKDDPDWGLPVVGGTLFAVVALSWQVWSLTRPETTALYGVEPKSFWGTRRQWGIGLAIFFGAVAVVAGLMWATVAHYI